MAETKKLVLLHSNDMHGDFLSEQTDEKLVGGVSLLSGYIGRVREQEPNTLYCIAGDMFRGSVIYSEYHGISTIEIMNTLSPDVVTVGMMLNASRSGMERIGGCERMRMGASMPASRSAMPSSISATARKLAPASSAAFAQGTAPWP